jgi:DinB superfamily
VPRRSLSSDEVLILLAEAPRRITAVTEGVDRAQLAAGSSGEWSALEVLAHLRACADVWGGCISRIIRADQPAIRAVNPRTWIKETGYAEAAFDASLKSYASQRAELLRVLEALPRRGWSRTAIVTGAGRPLERSVLFYADWLARHERAHLRQITGALDAIRRHGIAQ